MTRARGPHRVAEVVFPQVDGADGRHAGLAQLDERVAEGARAGVAAGVALRLDVEVGEPALGGAFGGGVLDGLRTKSETGEGERSD